MISLGRRSHLKQYGVAVCLGTLYVGMSYTWSSPVIPQLEHGENTPFSITTEEASWTGSIIAFGAALFAVPSGYLADNFGRKMCTLLLTIPIIVFIVLVYVGDNVYYIYAGRIFSGFATGGFSAIAPMYLTEIADVEVRASLNSFLQVLLCCGSLCNAVFGKYLDYKSFTLLSNGLGIVFITGFLFFPESPKYLMMKGNRAGAEKSLKFYRDDYANIKLELDSILNEMRTKASNKDTFWTALKSKAAKRSLLACLGIMFLQITTGVDVLLYYTVSVFEIAGTNLDPYTSSITVSLTQVFSTCLSVTITEKFKRKTFLYISTAGVGITLGMLGMFFQLKGLGYDTFALNLVPLVSMILFFIFYFIGLGPIPWLLRGELFPVEIKGPASGLMVTVGWVITFTVTKTYPLLVEAFQPQYTFYFYAFCMVVCLVFTKFFVPETKGKTLQEIEEELSR